MHVHGRCACGQVSFEVHGEALAQVYCHCRSCQLAHAAPVVAAALFRAASFSFAGEVARVKITDSPHATSRASCARCGTKVFNEPPPPVRAIFPSLCAARDWFSPSMHLHWRDRIVDVADALPRFLDLPTELGGTGEKA
jgi:hypothetical protein